MARTTEQHTKILQAYINRLSPGALKEILFTQTKAYTASQNYGANEQAKVQAEADKAIAGAFADMITLDLELIDGVIDGNSEPKVGVSQITAGYWTTRIFADGVNGDFEHNENGSGGNLIFEDRKLLDYSGMATLPSSVIYAIRRLGFTIDKDFE